MPAAGQDGAQDGRFDLAGMEVVLVLGQKRILLDSGKPFGAESQQGQGDTQSAKLDPKNQGRSPIISNIQSTIPQ